MWHAHRGEGTVTNEPLRYELWSEGGSMPLRCLVCPIGGMLTFEFARPMGRIGDPPIRLRGWPDKFHWRVFDAYGNEIIRGPAATGPPIISVI
jgi:hypothetical protein